jgi:hypothetical protein
MLYRSNIKRLILIFYKTVDFILYKQLWKENKFSEDAAIYLLIL